MNSKDIAAPGILNLESHMGCRSSSRVAWGNAGYSSRIKTPLYENDISPGPGILHLPTSPTCEIVWCRNLKGRSEINAVPIGLKPAILWIFVHSSASSKMRDGSMVPIHRASIVLPEPGGPSISKLWEPATAISRARLPCSYPFTFWKSSSYRWSWENKDCG